MTPDHDHGGAPKSPEERQAAERVRVEEGCDSCPEGIAGGECPPSERACGHHCNCIWVHDVCHWCGAYVNEDGDVVAARNDGRDDA